MTEIAKQLRLIRAENNLSITDHSKKTGITIQTISAINRGKENININTLRRLVKPFGYKLNIKIEK